MTVLLLFAVTLAIWSLLFEFHVTEVDPHGRKIPLVLFFFGSLLLGGAVALYVGKVMIQPIQKIGRAFCELSEGNFSVRVPEDGRIVEMREIAKQFNAMTYDLSHTETLRTDFVANVSHEFKTPLSSVEGYATLLQTPNLPEEKRMYYAEKILENSRRLSTLTSNILLLSKLENQEMIIDNKKFRLDEQIRKTILLLEDRWSVKEIRFDMDLPIRTYYGSERLLGQIFYNIIDNAVKYSPRGGTVHIAIETSEDDVTVEISDEGEGMTEEVMRHIFEKFYQGDSSRKAEGNGLGLALVKRIADICGAEISVFSQKGEGSTFLIKLPNGQEEE